MFPMHDMLRGRVFEAPPADPSLSSHPPQMHLKAAKPITPEPGLRPSSSAACVQLDLELRLSQPAVGVLNVTGHIQAWVQGAFPDPEPQVKQQNCLFVKACLSSVV